jgi:YD repeat-containing protein
VAVDNLTYVYTGNRVTSVTDASGNNTGIKSGTSSYAYDANGNMTSDGNRGANIIYNRLNLPQKVTVGSKILQYDYDYAGTKRKYQTDTLNVKYAGPFEYRLSGTTNNFYRLALEEGQAVYRNNAIQVEYYLKDHQGNVRVVFDEAGKIIQKSDYYPFGLEIDRTTPAQTPAVRNGINRYNFWVKKHRLRLATLICKPGFTTRQSAGSPL